MTFEEEKLFAENIIKDIEANSVKYVGDEVDKMCSVGNACKIIVSYDATGAVISVLGIKNGVFHRMYSASPMKEYVLKIEKLCSDKGVNERSSLVNTKHPRIR